MAKAKRERRTSIRTMPTESSTDILDRLDAIEREQARAAEARRPEVETPPAAEGAPETATRPG